MGHVRLAAGTLEPLRDLLEILVITDSWPVTIEIASETGWALPQFQFSKVRDWRCELKLR